MNQLALFDETQVEDVRRQVLKEFTRLEGEDWDEYLEVVRIEVDYRLAELRKNKKKPTYKSTICKKNPFSL